MVTNPKLHDPNRRFISQDTRGSFMKGLYRSLGIIFAVVCLAAGCSSSSSTAAAAPAASSPSNPAAPAATAKTGGVTYVKTPLSNQMTTATITDPSLNNMLAATLTVPAGWQLQGIEMQSPCTNGQPWPVFRAFSPDGLMQFRIEPVVGWAWPSGPQNDSKGCAKVTGTIPAAKFLEYYLGTVQGGVHIVAPMPVSAAYTQWAKGLASQFDQNNSGLPPAMRTSNTADTAALRIQVVNGSFVVEERLRVAVECSVRNNAGVGNGGNCWARIDVLAAPQGRLDALVQLVDGNNLPHGVNNQQWAQAVFQRLQQNNARVGAAMLAQLTAQERAASQMLYSAFQQNMARSASEHQTFMQQQEASFQSSMNNANAAMNARTTAASDFVDFALDQQTVNGPAGPFKVSSAYSQTWSNGTQYYQTNDPNANPNGVLQGNWTPTTQVHGNGQPK
jgi:hypothetical protein